MPFKIPSVHLGAVARGFVCSLVCQLLSDSIDTRLYSLFTMVRRVGLEPTTQGL